MQVVSSRSSHKRKVKKSAHAISSIARCLLCCVFCANLRTSPRKKRRSEPACRPRNICRIRYRLGPCWRLRRCFQTSKTAARKPIKNNGLKKGESGKRNVSVRRLADGCRLKQVALAPRVMEKRWERALGRASMVIMVGDVHGCNDELQTLLRLEDSQLGDQMVTAGMNVEQPVHRHNSRVAQGTNAAKC